MIPAYQIHNVLRAFTKNLVNNGTGEPSAASAMVRCNDPGSGGAGGKRKAVMDKITDSIVDEITQMGSAEGCFLETLLKDRNEAGSRSGACMGGETRFAYQVIDGNGEKQTKVCFI